MFELIWKKSNYLTGMLAFGVLMGLVVFLSNFEIADFDLWLHLKTGEVIVEQGFIPVRDFFSCTMAGHPWNNHEWLFQVIFYLALSLSGIEGLFTAQVFIVGITFLLLFLLSDIHRRHYITVLLLFLLTMVYQSRLTMRPDLLSLLFFTIYIYVLSLHLDKRISLWVLTAIQVLWVNVHGFFIFGPLLVLLSIVSELIKRHVKLPWQWNKVGRLTDQELKCLGSILFFSILACLVNPQHLQGAIYPFTVLWQMTGDSKIFFGHIQELQRPILPDTLWTFKHIAYKILIAISGYSFIVNRRRIDISALFLWVFFLIFSLQAVRNILFFGVVAYLVSILNFSDASIGSIMPFRFKSPTFKYITITILNIAMIIGMVHYGFKESRKIYFNFDKYEMKSYYGGINLRAYPWGATQFIKDHNIQGNFFNDFNAGAFLIGRCWPQVRVFIDGRTELYGPQFFKDYIKIWGEGDEASFLEADKKYQFTGALLSSSVNQISDKLVQYLYGNKEWVLVYIDHDAVIFLKDLPCNQAVIKAFRKNKENITFSNVDLQRLGSRGVFPYREIKRAYALEALGLDQLALEQTSVALLTSPEAAEAYYIRGKIFKKKKDFQRAFEDLRIATMLAGDDSNMRYQLALTCQELGNHKEAIHQLRILAKRDVRQPGVFLSLAKSFAVEGETTEAAQNIRKGLELGPKDLSFAWEAIDVLMSKGQYAGAIECCSTILSFDPRMALAYQKIGLCYSLLGQYDKAREAFARGLKIEPWNPALKVKVAETDKLLKSKKKK